MILTPASSGDAAALAVVHARSFSPSWSAEDMAALLEAPGGFGFLVREDGQEAVQGFVLARAIVDETEILTLAVDPLQRRHGLARALMQAALAAAIAAGAGVVRLEVAVDNAAAMGLYEALGFERVATRKGYYARAGRISVDAFLLRHTLNRRAG